MALTGVAVTTSSPKTVSSTSSGTARTSPMAYVSGVAAPQPMRPPESLMACMPSLRAGAPHAMWTWPSTPMTSADRPMTMRPLASGCSGCRMSRTAMPANRIGASRSRRPKEPVTRISTRSPTGPRRSAQVPAATISATPSSSSATPSLRWAGSRFLAPVPIPRNTAPTACARPNHRARTSRYTPPVGLGAGLGAGFFATAFLAGAFFAGARLAGGFFAAAFFAGAFAGAAAFLAGCFLAAEGREAMV
ncbi:hypothetical protein [Streptomyces sp. NPDC088254]|uniref:hypothetical protein n=1 Tax=Streptomyces sp. NPDC088254 TaxID=3365847 RepID=UPI0037F8298F